MNNWYNINKLSINLSKTNYMMIKSSRKRNHEFVINMQSSNGTIHTLERKDRIKYLGVMLDETISFKCHHLCLFTNVSKPQNNFKIKIHVLPNTFSSLTCIYPYISYAILGWGNTYKTCIQKVQTKQKHAVRLINFFLVFLSQLTKKKFLLMFSIRTCCWALRPLQAKWNESYKILMSPRQPVLTTSLPVILEFALKNHLNL